jgi:signal transduction histidine kinase
MLPSEPVSPPIAPEAPRAGSGQDLLSSVCHDLKAPLASIVMGAGFLQRVLAPEDASARRVVDAMLRAAERMNQVIASFGDLARLEAGTLSLEMGTHDPRRAMHDAHKRFAPEASAQGIEVALQVDPAGPPVSLRCDYARMVQGLHLLATCALRVVPEGGRVTMRASVSAGGLSTWTVSAERWAENGRRITADLPKPELAIARGIIELHGARLLVTRDDAQLAMSFALEGQPSAAL